MVEFENNAKVIELANKLISKAARRDITIDIDTAVDEVIDAIEEYINDRHYEATEENPFEDNYSRLILELAISSITKYGAEGEVAHSEGGINRSYDNASSYPLSLTKKIVPLVKGICL